MEALIANQKFESLAIVDTFESYIWTDRLWAAGDVEIYTAPSRENLALFKDGHYIFSNDSERVMIVEERLIESDAERGNFLTVRGRSLESILDRRIIWTQTTFDGKLQAAVKKYLNENVISPKLADRAIPNFIFEESTDPAIADLTVDIQFTGDNLYDVIQSLCESRHIGFKITLNASNQFVFKLYSGKDRSYAQTKNPYVVFSPTFENIINSNYLESKKAEKNVALIAGEGEGTARKTAIIGDAKGLERRELFVDARDISSNNGEITSAKYTKLLKQRGEKKIAEHKPVQSFEGAVETTQMFQYNRDFFLGDVVQITNEYGIEARSRVVEIVMSHNLEGYSVIPTFSKPDPATINMDILE